MLNRKGELYYIGKSKSLRSRLLSYFAESNAQEKGGRIIEQARAIQWETQPSDFASLVREQQLIRKFSPKWNVQGVPKRQRPLYLCLGRTPAYFFTSATPKENCIGVEGPFYGAARMRLAVDSLNKVFKLRDCRRSKSFALPNKCNCSKWNIGRAVLRLEVGTCVGPCAAACSRGQYDLQVNAAESFLDGFNDEPLVSVRDQMQQAVENQQYELAGRAHRNDPVARVRTPQTIDAAECAAQIHLHLYSRGIRRCDSWYLIHSGEIADVVRAPRSQSELEDLRPKLKSWAGISSNRLDRGHGAFPHTLQLVASWFKKNREQLDHTFAPNKADQQVVRGAISA